MSAKTFIILLFIGIGFFAQQNLGDTIFGVVVLAGLAFFAYLAWGN
jgi:threonine/homoserine/homoserine lactone efflux protein